jgi:hypothetical protein
VKIDLPPADRPGRRALDLRELDAELTDRFGAVPEPVANLLLLQEARLAAAELGAEAVTLRGGRMTVAPLTLTSAQVAGSSGPLRTPFTRLPAGRSMRPVLGASQVLETLDAILEIRREVAA